MQPYLVFLQESKFSGDNLSSFAKKVSSWGSLFVETDGASGGLGILWKESSASVQLIASDSNWQSIQVQSFQLKIVFYAFNIYRP